MGTLHYDSSHRFQFDDRTLAHLRAVIVSKLGHQESLLFTWTSKDTQRSIWLHPTIPVQFEFDEGEVPPLNRAWLEELTATANAPAGLRLLPEPAEPEQH
ncbi:hypothetical protein [Leucobacter massiliensis]|uniref:DUF7882 domain-containing protein n=1 Tax=Leucobacter massiliensis TaxID=1686285 RepID=A0A2S9QST3_9MICO|nr:hypothetical protein [Leucobacter massiliensis]PRI12629.1 hypothetical protein B4915_00765 [Leucobacter massiliensis]